MGPKQMGKESHPASETGTGQRMSYRSEALMVKRSSLQFGLVVMFAPNGATLSFQTKVEIDMSLFSCIV
jgi:hypothetical protein